MSIQLASICLEILISIIALLGILRGKKFMIGFVIAFGIYLYNDIANFYGWRFKAIGEGSGPLLLFIANIAIIFSVWKIYKKNF